MWERRYGAVRPERTETGRRVYSDSDIARLSLLRQGTLAGESIGQIAGLPVDDLVRLVAEAGDIVAAVDAEHPTNSADVQYHYRLCLDAVHNMDSVNLELRLLSASVALGQQSFLEQVLEPLLYQTGEDWSDGRLKVAHEHLASAVIRSLLGSMFVSSRTESVGPLLLSTTPSGQVHEFGALMASVTAAANGWRTLYLGPNLPAEDIAAAADRQKPAALALSIVYPPDDPRLPIELRKLTRLVGSDCPLLIGGRASGAYDEVIREINAVRIANLTDLRRHLTELRSRQGGQRAG